MTKVVILGHGGYGTAMKRNIGMLVGEVEDYRYVDFNEQDDLPILRQKLQEAVDWAAGSDILFCCDVAGGSPFREAAAFCAEHAGCCCVAGVNTSAYTEMSFNLELSASELANLALEVAKSMMLKFPPAEE